MMKKNRLPEFFLAERAKLVGYVRKLIDDAADRDAEDVVQDVMANLFGNEDIIIPVENLAGYVYRSLKNKVIDTFRKKNKMPLVSLDEGFMDGDGISLSEVIADSRYNVENEWERRELMTQLHETFEMLNEDEQAIIVATELDGISFGELSAEWGVPLGTLLARKARAIKKIKKILGVNEMEV